MAANWERVIRDIARERERALSAGRAAGLDREPFWPAVEGEKVTYTKAEHAARALRGIGVLARSFAVRTADSYGAHLFFGKRACSLLNAIGRCEPKPKTYTLYCEQDIMITQAWGVASHFADRLHAASLSDGDSLREILDSIQDLWKRALECRDALLPRKRELGIAKAVAAAYWTAMDVRNRLYPLWDAFSRGSWPKAAKLASAAEWVEGALADAMFHRPAREEDLGRAVDMLLWLRELEAEAEGDLGQIGLLNRMGERWQRGNSGRLPWKLLRADVRDGRVIPASSRSRREKRKAGARN